MLNSISKKYPFELVQPEMIIFINKID